MFSRQDGTHARLALRPNGHKPPASTRDEKLHRKYAKQLTTFFHFLPSLLEKGTTFFKQGAGTIILGRTASTLGRISSSLLRVRARTGVLFRENLYCLCI